MKILFVIRNLGAGGAEKSLVSFFNLLNENYLKQNDIQIDLLMTSNDDFFCDQIPGYINVIKCPKPYAAYCNDFKHALEHNNLTVTTLIRKIYSFLIKKIFLRKSNISAGELQWKYVGKTIPKMHEKYDIAAAYCHDASAYYVIDKVEANKKIIWIHNDYEKLGFSDIFERKMYSKANLLVTISDKCADSLVKHFPEMKSKIKVIENISSAKLIHKMSEVSYPDIYRKMKKDTIKFISVGRLMYQKGYDIGIEAFKNVLKKQNNFHWFIVGAGELEESLKEQVAEANLNDYVTFLGLQKNPYMYVYNADIFFQPSRFEGKSIALDEAMVLGKPILATKYNTVEDSVENGKNGILCEFDFNAIADSIIELMNNSDLRNLLAANQKINYNGNVEELNKYLEILEMEGAAL